MSGCCLEIDFRLTCPGSPAWVVCISSSTRRLSALVGYRLGIHVAQMVLLVPVVPLAVFGGFSSGPFATAALLLSIRPFVNVVWMVLAAPVALVVLLMYW